MFDIIRYTADRQEEWDAFITHSKNGTFLFMRGYMDYHADRFMDCSLMFYFKERLYAVMPANIEGTVLHSHQGLTYGGLIMDERCGAAEVVALFAEMNAWLKDRGLTSVIYKPIPHIYSLEPSEEDLYALFRCNAKVTARGISSAIDYTTLKRWHKDRRTALNRSRRNHITIRKTHDIRSFWTILITNLKDRHGVSPVHSVEEMELLIHRFPSNIILYEALDPENKTVAGMLAFHTRKVLHSQYLAASQAGKKSGAIEAIMEVVLQEEGFRYFDFGVSTEEGGSVLNEGLIYQKEGFGCRGICYDTYEYTLS